MTDTPKTIRKSLRGIKTPQDLLKSASTWLHRLEQLASGLGELDMGDLLKLHQCYAVVTHAAATALKEIAADKRFEAALQDRREERDRREKEITEGPAFYSIPKVAKKA